MPVNVKSSPAIDPTMVESETPLFAPIRTSKKGEKRSFFSDVEPKTRVVPETRVVRETRVVPPATTPATGQRLEEPVDTAFAPPPTFAGGRTTVKRNGMMAPMAIVGGLVLLAGVGAAGWYATQPHGGGLAQITPSDTTVTPVNPPADQLAQAPAPEAAPPASAKPTQTAKAEPAPRPVHVRAHAAASPAAADTGVNASAVVPAPAPAVRPATPPINALPPQAAPTPAPAPVIPPPADTPAPTQTAPTPPQQSPTPPADVPPQ